MKAYLRLPADAWRPARAKSTHAMFPSGQIAHRITGIQTTLYEGQILYRTQWLCSPQGGTRMTLIPEGAHEGRECFRCADITFGLVVYRLFDASGALLYVGATATKETRLRAHSRRAAWWPEVASHTFVRYLDEASAREAEVLAIRTENLKYNRLLRAHRTAAS